MITLQKTIENVIHAAHEGEPSTLQDIMIAAKVHEQGKARWHEVLRYMTKNLMPGRPFADLAGTKILPVGGRVRTESWAKGQSYETARRRHPNPDFRQSYAEMIGAMIEESNSMPADSPRRLPPILIRLLTKTAQVEVPLDSAEALAALNEGWAAELRAARMAASAQLANLELVRQNAALTAKLLTYQGQQSDGQGQKSQQGQQGDGQSQGFEGAGNSGTLN